MSLIKESRVALITGTSSNLGINIAYRLIDKLCKRDDLTLVVTSRTLPRAREVIDTINEYYKKNYATYKHSLEFDFILVDFGDMVSVLSMYYELNKRYKKVDYLFVNAAQGVYSGIDWLAAFKEIAVSPLNGVTNPQYKIQRVGVKSSDDLGLVFQANVFGPYYLIHKIKHLLKGGKVIWISSLTATPNCLSFNDLQLIQSPSSYEGSKRLVDLMHFGTYKKLKKENDITQYLVHPGIFTSFSFFQYLNVFTYYGMLFLFYMARVLGSPFHNISGKIASNAPIACALKDERQDVKIASASTISGEEYLIYEEVDTTGSEDVVKYLSDLCEKWDHKFKDQIVDSRKP